MALGVAVATMPALAAGQGTAAHRPRGAPDVRASLAKDRVDLYSYVSMTVAALKVQQQQLEALQREVDALRRELRTCAPRP